jgi:DNA topoisomerase VI subunit A
MTPIQVIEIAHLPIRDGRTALRTTDWRGAAIPSISPVLTERWMAQYKDKFLDPGDNLPFLTEIIRYVQTLNDITTQRSIYYAIRGAHPEWKYKGEALGDAFYEHLVMWLMEKLQLMTGMTMQSMGVWAAPRGYIAGDGIIRTTRRGQIPLSAKPSLSFDLADEGVVFQTYAKKVIHFEKDAGFESLTSGNYPKYIEAVFSTSQGQLSEAATKFLRKAEDTGMDLYSVHDGDPSGIQMQLLYGMATKNNCYMPSEFYPRLVRPLGFYPSIGVALGLPPELVEDKESRIFDNLRELLEGKERTFSELRRFDLAQEVDTITEMRQKWEFQALNAIHESAPKIYVLEGLRVHNDTVKYVPPPQTVKDGALASARRTAPEEADRAIEALASSLVQAAVPKVVEALRARLVEEIQAFESEVEEALAALDTVDGFWFREYVKRYLVSHPEQYAQHIIPALGKRFLKAEFHPTAKLDISFTLSDVDSTAVVEPYSPGEDVPVTTKTTLVSSIEKEIIPNATTRNRVVGLIRSALEQRFGKANDTW